jgi:hypothetical protein
MKEEWKRVREIKNKCKDVWYVLFLLPIKIFHHPKRIDLHDYKKWCDETYSCKKKLHLHLCDSPSNTWSNSDSKRKEGMGMLYFVLLCLWVPEPSFRPKGFWICKVRGISSSGVERHHNQFLLSIKGMQKTCRFGLK